MYYTLCIDPRLPEELSEAIEALRKNYDPTYTLNRPHVTVLFPIPGTVGERRLREHIEDVLRDVHPFEIRFGGFHKSRDHWLFLTLSQGESKVRELYQALYSGMLAEYGRSPEAFVPHIGLGLFLKPGCRYDWDNPRESEFDGGRFDEALKRARDLPQVGPIRVTALHLEAIPDEWIAWTRGERSDAPEGLPIRHVREFRLVAHGG